MKMGKNKVKMNRISFSYKERDYILEYTRASIRRMEAQGFRIDDVEGAPLSTLEALFEGAFYANHKSIRPALLEEIHGELSDKEGLYAKLFEMYAETVNTLVMDDEEDSGNIKWETAW